MRRSCDIASGERGAAEEECEGMISWRVMTIWSTCKFYYERVEERRIYMKIVACDQQKLDY